MPAEETVAGKSRSLDGLSIATRAANRTGMMPATTCLAQRWEYCWPACCSACARAGSLTRGDSAGWRNGKAGAAGAAAAKQPRIGASRRKHFASKLAPTNKTAVHRGHRGAGVSRASTLPQKPGKSLLWERTCARCLWVALPRERHSVAISFRLFRLVLDSPSR